MDGISPSIPDHIIIPPIGMVPFPTKSPAVTVPVTFASSVDVSCSAVTVPDAVTSVVVIRLLTVALPLAIRFTASTLPPAVILSEATISSVECKCSAVVIPVTFKLRPMIPSCPTLISFVTDKVFV